MATIKSVNVTDITLDPINVLDKEFGRVKFVTDSVSVDSGSPLAADDVILFAPIPSNAKIHRVNIRNDDLDSNGTPTLDVDWGLFYSGIGGNQVSEGNTIGTVLDKDAFVADSIDLQSGNKAGTDVRYGDADLDTKDNEAWEFGGALTADPGGVLFLGATVITAAATAASGDIVVEISYL
jgi:hypothetical protein